MVRSTNELTNIYDQPRHICFLNKMGNPMSSPTWPALNTSKGKVCHDKKCSNNQMDSFISMQFFWYQTIKYHKQNIV